MTEQELLSVAAISDAVKAGTIIVRREECTFCGGIGSRHLGRAGQTMTRMFLDGKYATPEFAQAERMLPRTRCGNCDGTGYESVPYTRPLALPTGGKER